MNKKSNTRETGENSCQNSNIGHFALRSMIVIAVMAMNITLSFGKVAFAETKTDETNVEAKVDTTKVLAGASLVLTKSLYVATQEVSLEDSTDDSVKDSETEVSDDDNEDDSSSEVDSSKKDDQDNKKSKSPKDNQDNEMSKSPTDDGFTQKDMDRINSNIPSGNKLTRRLGVFNNRWGHKEKYYNLNMSGVVEIMRNKGFSSKEYPYWVRADGVKMLGPYIMIAANLNRVPRGKIVQTSLGTAIVVDTGSFVRTNPDQYDIAVSW